MNIVFLYVLNLMLDQSIPSNSRDIISREACLDVIDWLCVLLESEEVISYSGLVSYVHLSLFPAALYPHLYIKRHK